MACNLAKLFGFPKKKKVQCQHRQRRLESRIKAVLYEEPRPSGVRFQDSIYARPKCRSRSEQTSNSKSKDGSQLSMQSNIGTIMPASVHIVDVVAQVPGLAITGGGPGSIGLFVEARLGAERKTEDEFPAYPMRRGDSGGKIRQRHACFDLPLSCSIASTFYRGTVKLSTRHVSISRLQQALLVGGKGGSGHWR